jgi:hypothetical protein
MYNIEHTFYIPLVNQSEIITMGSNLEEILLLYVNASDELKKQVIEILEESQSQIAPRE